MCKQHVHFLASLVVLSSKQQPRKNFGFPLSRLLTLFFWHELMTCTFNATTTVFFFFFLCRWGNAERNHIGSANKLSFDFASSPNNGHECTLITFGSVSLVCVCMCESSLSPGGWKCQPVSVSRAPRWWRRAGNVRTSLNCVLTFSWQLPTLNPKVLSSVSNLARETCDKAQLLHFCQIERKPLWPHKNFVPPVYGLWEFSRSAKRLPSNDFFKAL